MKLKMRSILTCVLLLGLAVSAAAQKPDGADAGIPRSLSYEGYITDHQGEVLADGRYGFTFAIYTSAEGGSPIWTEAHRDVDVAGGLVRLMLGQGTDPHPLDLPFDRPYFLGIRFEGEPEMSPRMALAASGFAFRAGVADEVPDASITAEKLAKGAVTDEKIESVSWSKITGAPDGEGAQMISSDFWSLRGNIKTKPPVDFLGTTDFNDLVFKTDNTERVRLGKEGNTHVAQNIVMQDDNAIGSAVISSITPGVINYEMRERIHFDEDDNDIEMMGADVGVGERTPEAKFHVVGTGEIMKEHVALFENEPNDEGVAITSNQDVGIGTEEPRCKLHVKGPGRFAAAPSVMSEPLYTGSTAMEENHVALFENTENGDGIAIKVNAGTPSTSNNFVSFLNGSDHIVGRIEGETVGELHNRNWDFVWHTVMFGVDIIGLEAERSGAKSQKDDQEAEAINGQIVKLLAEYLEWEINRILTVGVAYNSSAGDYAEYLERIHAGDEISDGDIVGVYGGRISLATAGAQQLMAVSTAPIVLGNMPPEANLHLYEKVAFMGQVPVKVRGAVREGDYIIPSGLDDGTGVAVPPEMMTAEEYGKVVGRAWSGSALETVKRVNVAVGLNGGDIAHFVKQQNRELLKTRTELAGLKEELAEMKRTMARWARSSSGQPDVMSSQQ